MTLRELARAREAEIANLVKLGTDIAEISQRYKAGKRHIRTCCRIYGVELPEALRPRRVSKPLRKKRGRPLTPLALNILAELRKGKLSHADIARLLDSSRQRVGQIAKSIQKRKRK